MLGKSAESVSIEQIRDSCHCFFTTVYFSCSSIRYNLEMPAKTSGRGRGIWISGGLGQRENSSCLWILMSPELGDS